MKIFMKNTRRFFSSTLIVNKMYILKVFIQFFHETCRKVTNLLINLIMGVFDFFYYFTKYNHKLHEYQCVSLDYK